MIRKWLGKWKAKGPVAPVIDYGPDSYHAVWEKKRQPSPGAMAYAYETLGLIPFSPVGPAVGTDGQIESVHQPLYQFQALPWKGIPLVAGQFNLQPLYNPQTNMFSGNDSIFVPPASMFLNDPEAASRAAINVGRPL